MSVMLQEIEQQPEVISRVVAKNRKALEKICKDLNRRVIDFVLFHARGTSDNAAAFGKYIFGYTNGFPVGMTAPSLLSLYKKSISLHNALVIGISQSGESIDIVDGMRQAKKLGAYCVAVTNQENSSIVKQSHAALYCNAGPERSVPATKTYTSQLALLHLLACSLGGKTEVVSLLAKVPGLMRKILSQKEVFRAAVEPYRYIRECLVLGRGFNYATALETALKLKETCYLRAEAMSGTDFLHGPIAIVDKNFPVILFAPPDPTYKSMLDVAKKLRAKEAEIIAVSSEPGILKLAHGTLRMPKMDPMLTPITYILAGQLFSYYLSLTKGMSPDHPRGLRKITLTM